MPEDRMGPKRATSPFVKGVSELEVRPWRTSAQEPLDRRRRELYKLAAPVFREHGYRGATIKALAHACHWHPPASTTISRQRPPSRHTSFDSLTSTGVRSTSIPPSIPFASSAASSTSRSSSCLTSCSLLTWPKS